ncbi:MAG: 2-oxo acid dehydrogenase subunit E2 [Candidatus Lambdaproteobacteria bacterium]|nr:2-oxo acid dehydrogenase subunit E2 [Candidatus Lambdaproteobacteria bacterium]
MVNLVTMPSLSPTMEVGAISLWKKKVGEPIAAGEVLAEIETDKAVVEFQLADEGFVREFLVQPGQEIAVGTPIAIVTDAADEDYSAALAQAKAASAPQAAAPAAPSAAEGSAVAAQAPAALPAPAARPAVAQPSAPAAAAVAAPATAPGDGRVRISPYARKLAEAGQLDWHRLAGSGPGGRIVSRDVEAALAAGPGAAVATPPAAAPFPAGAAYADVPLTLMRKAIARKMSEAKQTVPHFQLTRKVRAERLLEARAGLKESFPELAITLNDLIVKGCAAALRRHPAINSQFLGDRVRRFSAVDIAVAVGTEEGLVTPVLRNAEQKGLAQISQELRALGERARERKLAPEEYQGGTFTISNLGMFGVDEFNAIINTPQACILAVAGIVREPVVEGDALAIGRTMNLTLSSDHRAVDGVAAAQFMETLVRILSNPVALTL